MAENEKSEVPNKKKKRNMGFGPAEASEFDESELANVEPLSDDEIEKFLKEEDPDFIKKVAKISSDSSISISDIDLDTFDEALYQETQIWRSSRGWRYLLFWIYPSIPRTSLQIKKLRVQFRSFTTKIYLGLRTNLKVWLIQAVKALKTQSIKIAKFLLLKAKIEVQNFAKLPWKAKVIGLVAILLVLGTVALIVQIQKGKSLLHPDSDPYIKSLEEVANSVETYDPENEVEAFYDNLRSAPNLIYLQKMVVNIRPGKLSGSNPMAAAEFYLEGSSPDVTIEAKEKEVALRDLGQRTMERFSYDQLVTGQGKRDLCEKLKQTFSQMIVSGSIRSVQIKTFILKP